MYYKIKKVWNVISKLNDDNGDDINVISFSTRYEAKKYYERLTNHLKSMYTVEEYGKAHIGDMCCCTTLKHPYYYVRLSGCELESSCFRLAMLNYKEVKPKWLKAN